jgi:hypothetical protein
VILIVGGIAKAISFLNKRITLAAKGDLTTSFDTREKDEFLHLSQGIGNMLSDMRKLIGEVSWWAVGQYICIRSYLRCGEASYCNEGYLQNHRRHRAGYCSTG